ncbi:MAG: carbon-nitrogen hydrolase family protein [Alphaproteobacteria bacterium]|nr:carbon-nitrogen hydrolase family protein [Alphaproteobacteria bacterium]
MGTPAPGSTRRLVATAQLPGRGGALPDRLAEAEDVVARAAARGADLIVLPEGYVPGYQLREVDEVPLVEGRRWLGEAARRHRVHIALGVMSPSGSLLELAGPEGGRWSYRKRFPTFREARYWGPGEQVVIAETSIGRVGLVLCADLMQGATWRPLIGRVDLIAMAAAWPHYSAPPDHLPAVVRQALGPVFIASNPYREQLMPQVARAVGAPLVFSNATGPFLGRDHFAGGAAIFDADGRELARAEGDRALVLAEVTGATPPGAPLKHPVGWRTFNALHRWAAAGRFRYGRRGGSGEGR